MRVLTSEQGLGGWSFSVSTGSVQMRWPGAVEVMREFGSGGMTGKGRGPPGHADMCLWGGLNCCYMRRPAPILTQRSDANKAAEAALTVGGGEGERGTQEALKTLVTCFECPGLRLP